jgi:excisionase family DNA binding protein
MTNHQDKRDIATEQAALVATLRARRAARAARGATSRIEHASTLPDRFAHLHDLDLMRRLIGEPPTLDAGEGDAPRPERRERAVIPSDPDALLTADQAAAYLGVTVEQLTAHVKGGAIKYINVGRGEKKPRYRFTRADLDTFKSDRTTTEQPCPSSSRKNPRHTTGSISKSNVVGFTALRAARLAKKPSGSKP